MPSPREPREPQPALGAAIRRLRKRIPLTQHALAERAGISLNYVSILESGGNPEIATLKKIASGLEVSMVELFTVVERVELE